MSQRVFVDASAWIPVIFPRDRLHESARQVLEALKQEKALLVTTNWTAYEAVSWLKGRDGYDVARLLWRVLTDRNLVWWESITPEIKAQAVEIFWRYKDKRWGVVDCASHIVMELTGCLRAFGYDRHFQEAALQYGFSLLGLPG